MYEAPNTGFYTTLNEYFDKHPYLMELVFPSFANANNAFPKTILMSKSKMKEFRMNRKKQIRINSVKKIINF